MHPGVILGSVRMTKALKVVSRAPAGWSISSDRKKAEWKDFAEIKKTLISYNDGKHSEKTIIGVRKKPDRFIICSSRKGFYFFAPGQKSKPKTRRFREKPKNQRLLLKSGNSLRSNSPDFFTQKSLIFLTVFL